jgi:hypothetical protein
MEKHSALYSTGVYCLGRAALSRSEDSPRELLVQFFWYDTTPAEKNIDGDTTLQLGALPLTSEE